MWSIRNILAGAASVQPFGPRSDYLQILDQIQARAEAEGATTDVTFRQHMLERTIGQFLMTVVSLSAIFVAVVGVSHGWSDWIVAPVALMPMTLMVAVSWFHQSNSRNFAG
jgi:hypothetical protein